MVSLAEAEAHMARLKSMARDAFVAKDWAAARALYTECLEIHPSAALFSNRAACFVELRLYRALADADLALERDPTFAKAQFQRPGLRGLNMLGDAVEAYEAGLALGRRSGPRAPRAEAAAPAPRAAPRTGQDEAQGRRHAAAGAILLGDKGLDQIRGKGISLHSQAINEFCIFVGASTKTKGLLVKKAKNNGDTLGFLV
ncbi:hypothetical protein JL721_12581 [Aureococcus anophagefferens]|nr:hypothetical protein JL721_12581 [Aureococcus anophagefferens]